MIYIIKLLYKYFVKISIIRLLVYELQQTIKKKKFNNKSLVTTLKAENQNFIYYNRLY